MKKLKLDELERKYVETEKLLKEIDTEIHVRKNLMLDCKQKMLDGIIQRIFNISYVCRLTFSNELKCTIDDLDININKYSHHIQVVKNNYIYNLYYTNENVFYTAYKKSQAFITRHKATLNRLLPIIEQYDKIIRSIEKYGSLIYLSNYMECITFLLCNSKLYIFPRGVDIIIAKKILFFFLKKNEKKYTNKQL